MPLFKTKKSYYYYSETLNKIILVHPALAFIIQQEGTASPAGEDGKRNFSKKELNYYYKKYRLLKENGYFDSIDRTKEISRRYTGRDIENGLHNNKHITFEVTNHCNLKCAYCIYGDLYQGHAYRKNRYLNPKSAKTLLDYMVKRWNSPKNRSYNKQINIGFYGGESLLNFPFIEEMVLYVKSIPLKHNHFTFSLTTNGTMLHKYMDFLVKNRFHLLVSLDGDEKHNAFRVFHNGSPIFKTVYNNILKLRRRFPEYFGKYVRFSCVLHSLNSLQEIHDFFQTEFNKIPHITEVSRFDVKEGREEALSEIYRSITESLNRAENRLEIQKNLDLQTLPGYQLIQLLNHYSNDTFKNIEDLLSGTPAARFPTGTCIPLRRRLFLTVDGIILPCERVAHRHQMGRVSENKVEIDFHKIADKYNRIFDDLSGRCRRCANTQTCRACVLKLDSGKDGYQCHFAWNRGHFEKFLSDTTAFLEENPGLYEEVAKELFFE